MNMFNDRESPYVADNDLWEHELSDDKDSLDDALYPEYDGGGTCTCCGMMRAMSCFDPGWSMIYKGGFETVDFVVGNPPEGWNHNSGSGRTIEVKDPGLGGTGKSVYILHSSSSAATLEHKFIKLRDPIIAKFIVKHISNLNNPVIIEIFKDDGGRDNIVQLKLENGQVKNQDTPTGFTYVANQELDFELTIDQDDSSYQLKINGNNLGNFPILTSVNIINGIEFKSLVSLTEFEVDEVSIIFRDEFCSTEEENLPSMLVMTDGQSNKHCFLDPVPNHDTDGNMNNDPEDHAVEIACVAQEKYGITVYSVLFGNINVNNDEYRQMQAIADCGNGTLVNATSAAAIVDAFQNISQDILESAFEQQTLIVPGDLFTQVFPDSFIDFTYVVTSNPLGLIITSEEGFEDVFSGRYRIPADAELLETRVSSYSGQFWTDTLDINGDRVYELSDYGSDYIELGDPYSLNIPNDDVDVSGAWNDVILTIASVPDEGLAGSMSNKIIYTIAKDFTTFTGIKTLAEGCLWNIAFENEENITSLKIPFGYTGTDQCYYAPAFFFDGSPSSAPGGVANTNDVLQVAVFELLTELDINQNNLVEVPFPEDGIRIDTTGIQGIPVPFESNVQARIWSC